jgi:hypothetical protein
VREGRRTHQTALFVEDLPDTAPRCSSRKSQRKVAPQLLQGQVKPPHSLQCYSEFCRICPASLSRKAVSPSFPDGLG